MNGLDSTYVLNYWEVLRLKYLNLWMGERACCFFCIEKFASAFFYCPFFDTLDVFLQYCVQKYRHDEERIFFEAMNRCTQFQFLLNIMIYWKNGFYFMHIWILRIKAKFNITEAINAIVFDAIFPNVENFLAKMWHFWFLVFDRPFRSVAFKIFWGARLSTRINILTVEYNPWYSVSCFQQLTFRHWTFSEQLAGA